MPVYFFDINDGAEIIRDPEGSTLLDLSAAQIEATETLTQMSRYLFPGSDGKSLSIDVRDDDGKALIHVALRLQVTAA